MCLGYCMIEGDLTGYYLAMTKLGVYLIAACDDRALGT